MRTWGTEFKQFLLRGNVVDLAVGIVIGAAFAAVVQAAVTDLLTPLVAAIFGQPDFNAWWCSSSWSSPSTGSRSWPTAASPPTPAPASAPSASPRSQLTLGGALFAPPRWPRSSPYRTD